MIVVHSSIGIMVILKFVFSFRNLLMEQDIQQRIELRLLMALTVLLNIS